MRKSAALLASCLFILVTVTPVTEATTVYQQPQDFVDEVFAGLKPEVKRLWIKKDLKRTIASILGHELPLLRIRYWQHQRRTAWVLEEIGKSELITMGFVINGGIIEQTRVLVFRESRGFEIRYPFFTDQYRDLSLSEDLNLNGHIDGISGATLSVTAANKLARLALLLHRHSEAAGEQPSPQ